MRLIYAVPHPEFFDRRHCGSIAHAIGLLNAFLESGWEVHLICGTVSTHHRKALGLDMSRIHQVRDVTASSEYSRSVSRAVAGVVESGDDQDNIVLIRHSTLTSGKMVREIRRVNKDIPLAVELNSFLCHRRAFPRVVRESLRFLESIPLRKVDLVYSVSDELTRDVKRSPLKNSAFVTCRNGGGSYQGTRLKDLGEQPHLLYIGNLNSYDGLPRILDSAKNQPGELPLQVRIIGEGKLLHRLRAKFRANKSVSFYGYLGFEEAIDLGVINKASIGLVPYIPPNIPVGSPTKLFDMLSYGIPIVTPRIGQPSSIVDEAKVGWTFSLDSQNWIKELADSITASPLLCQWRRNIEDNFDRNFLWLNTLSPLIQAMESLVVQKRNC